MRITWPFCLLLMALLLVTAVAVSAKAPENHEKVVTYVGWSTTALYVAFRVDDPMIVGDQTLWLGQPWLDDAVAVYLNLDPKHATDTLNDQCVRVVISAAGGATVQRGGEGEWHDDPSWFDPLAPNGTIRYAVKLLEGAKVNDNKLDHGYQVVMGLSWTLLGVRPPVVGSSHHDLPAIGFAIVNYSQGETQSVSCWPTKLTEDDLSTPTHWGFLQFAQDMHQGDVADNLLSATRLPGDIQVDGELGVHDWITTGIVSFDKRLGPAVLPEQQGKQMVNLLAAWYQLDPFAATLPQQPLLPVVAGMDAESPLYHMQQLQSVRDAGIDALAVVLPTDPTRRERTRQCLIALRSALRDYAASTARTVVTNVPLVLPVLDLSGLTALDLRSDAGMRTLEAALDDYQQLIPPQFRVMLPGADQRWYYPVVLTAPSPDTHWDGTFTARVGADLRAQWGAPVGWILDSAWKGSTDLPGVLAYCALTPPSGFQLGDGTLRMALLMPGAGDSTRDTLLRRKGETFRNAWLKAMHARPDLLLLRSWNDYQHGSAVAASRVEGYEYVDTMKLDQVHLAQEQGFGVRMLRHNLPSTLLSGREYPLDILLKNGSVRKIVTADGFRVDYHIRNANGETVLSGLASDRLLLLELAEAHLRFTLPLLGTDHRPLAAGAYQLVLEIHRNALRYLNTALFRTRLGALTIPFTVSDAVRPAQLVESDYPDIVAAGASAGFTVCLRNTTKSAWRRNVAIQLRWLTESGEALPLAPVTLPCKSVVASGNVMTWQTDLPPAPQQSGWYHLQVAMSVNGGDPVELDRPLLRVQPADIRANFRNIAFPRTIAPDAEAVDVPLLVKNCGATKWTTADAQITYQWLAWNGQPLDGTAGATPLTETVAAGDEDIVHVHVKLPAGSGSFYCAFGVKAAGLTAQLLTDAAESVSPLCPAVVHAARYLPVSLFNAYTPNDSAAYADASVARPAFCTDVQGKTYAFPLEEFLPDLNVPPSGYQPGYGLGVAMVDAPGFVFGAFSKELAPVVRAQKQAITLPSQPASALYLVATDVAEPHATVFTVRYADGSEQQTALTVSNWTDKPLNGEPVMLKTRHLHTAEGDDWDLSGSLYVYKIPLDPARPPAALLLPDAIDISVFAMTLETTKGGVGEKAAP